MPRDLPLDLRADQLGLALAACTAPLRAFGWNVPEDHDLSAQASGVRIDHLRRLAAMAGREVVKGIAIGRCCLGPQVADLDLDAAELPEGPVLPGRVRNLAPVTSQDERSLELLANAARDAGLETA